MVGSTGNNICLVATSIVSLAGIFITFIRRKNRKNVVIRPSVKITYPWKLTLGDYAWVGDDVNLYTLGEITIGAHSVISQKSYLCTGSHDHASQHFTINATPIVIGEKCWLATDVFVALASRSATAPSWVREAVFLNRFRQMWFAGESRSGDTRTR